VVNAARCVTVGAGVALVSAAGGLDPIGRGITGSLIVGASVAGVGLVGVGVGAVMGQVTSTSRGANAFGSIVLGACYVLRMVGDLGDGRLTWASPIGWGQEMQPWGEDRWWPFGLLVLLAAALLTIAAWLEARRDLGSGLLPERGGRGWAPAWYATPFGLGLRLQRGPIVGWTCTIVLSALLFGSVVKAMTDLMADATGIAANLIRGIGVDALLSLLLSLIAMITTVGGLLTLRRSRRDHRTTTGGRDVAQALGAPPPADPGRRFGHPAARGRRRYGRGLRLHHR
jgi:ABC-2 type transport system permease protein